MNDVPSTEESGEKMGSTMVAKGGDEEKNLTNVVVIDTNKQDVEASSDDLPPTVGVGSSNSSCGVGYSLHRRWQMYIFSFCSTSLVAGIVYGWPALRSQLVKEDGSTLTETELGAIFTAAAWTTLAGRFVTGLARDRYGTRLIACLALLCTCAGAVGIAFANANDAVALGVSVSIAGLGGGLQLTVQPVGGLFPEASNAVISSITGAFQVSSLIFLALTRLPLTRRQAFLGYAFVVAALMVQAWFLLPKTATFELPKDDETGRPAFVARTTSSISVDDDDDDDDDLEDKEDDHKKTRRSIEAKKVAESIHCGDATTNMNVPPPPPPDTKWEQILSTEYLSLVLWFSICLAPMQYLIASIGFQLEERGDDTGFYTDFFSVVYAGSAILSPATGYLSDRLGVGMAQGIASVLVAISFFILGFDDDIISLDGQLPGLVCYCIGRMMVFGLFFSNIGRRFGFVHFGTLSGIGLLVSATVSLAQNPMIAAASKGGRSPLIVNQISACVLIVCTLPYCVWLARMERRKARAESLILSLSRHSAIGAFLLSSSRHSAISDKEIINV